MGLNARKETGGSGGKDYVEQDVLENGTYPGRLVQLIDLGVQPQRPYQGQEKPPVHTVSVTYEFSDEFMKDDEGNDVEDKPRWISESFPFYSLEATLAKCTKRYYALDPKEVFEGDWPELVGGACNIVVGSYTRKSGKNAGKDANTVMGLTAMRSKESDKLPPLVNGTKVFLLDEPDMDVFASLPDWMQGDIKDNLEYAGSKLEALLTGGTQPTEEDKDEDQWDDE